MDLNFIFSWLEHLRFFSTSFKPLKLLPYWDDYCESWEDCEIMDSQVPQHNELNRMLIKALRGICSYWEYNTIIVNGVITIWWAMNSPVEIYEELISRKNGFEWFTGCLHEFTLSVPEMSKGWQRVSGNLSSIKMAFLFAWHQNDLTSRQLATTVLLKLVLQILQSF